MSEHTIYHFRPTSPVAGNIWLLDTKAEAVNLVAENVPNNIAAFIVRACNSHDAMVDALEMVLDAGTDDGEEKSATDIVEAIDWPMLRNVLASIKDGAK